MDLALNALIAALMLGILLTFLRSEGTWSFRRLKSALRYFTVLSNLLCAVAACLMCFFPADSRIWLLKYVGTAAVTVTMLTVLLFLGPSFGYRDLLKGPDLVMHLINPILALVSFCLFERRGLAFPPALTGLIPVALYAVLYGCKVLLVRGEKAWEDFYGFNRTGKWYLSVAAMLTGTFLICIGLMGLQNL